MLYPSARKDADVTFENGKCIAFSGWNCVLFRDAPRYGLDMPNCLSFSTFDYSPWATGWGPDVHVAVAADGPNAGSWQVRGLERHLGERYAERMRVAALEYWPPTTAE
jgi:hypothetical protein